jgi:hypothetical protein
MFVPAEFVEQDMRTQIAHGAPGEILCKNSYDLKRQLALQLILISVQ